MNSSPVWEAYWQVKRVCILLDGALHRHTGSLCRIEVYIGYPGVQHQEGKRFSESFLFWKRLQRPQRMMLHLIIHILMGFSLPCFHFQKIRSLVYTILAAEVECISWFCFVFLFLPFYSLIYFFLQFGFCVFPLTRGFENVSLCSCLDFNY